MKEYFEHRDCPIYVTEVIGAVHGERISSFTWTARAYGNEVGEGTAPSRQAAFEDACHACDQWLDRPYRFSINLCEDGSVVTEDGEYLGTWIADAEDHPSFIPDGATEPLFSDYWIGSLCKQIADWHAEQNIPSDNI